jgi:hypothetical protein
VAAGAPAAVAAGVPAGVVAAVAAAVTSGATTVPAGVGDGSGRLLGDGRGSVLGEGRGRAVVGSATAVGAGVSGAGRPISCRTTRFTRAAFVRAACTATNTARAVRERAAELCTADAPSSVRSGRAIVEPWFTPRSYRHRFTRMASVKAAMYERAGVRLSHAIVNYHKSTKEI